MELSNITFKRGNNLILAAVNGIIVHNKITVLMGESGSGKTTLLRIMAGLEKPTTGSCIREASESIGIVFQQLHLFPHMTVLEQIAHPLYAVRGMSKARAYERAQEALESVGLSLYNMRYPHELSGGQQQRVAIARAIALRPTVLILDEPTSGLDGVTRDNLILLLKQLRDEWGMSIIMTTHDAQCAVMIADYVWTMQKGHIVCIAENGFLLS